jgi:type IV pilus assembly protein PilY1
MRVIRFFSYLRFIQISKRFLGITVPFLILVGMISPSSGASNPEFDGSVPSYSWSKSTFGNVTYWDQDPPNILFLIDTSGSMVEDPRSTRANPILTYGDGSLPWNNNYYWGTDTDNRNNDPDIASNYHPLLTRRPDGRLVPNDSRLYILRNVMYRLFTERTELLKGINVGIATYAQEKIDDGVFTGRGQHWYWYNSGENFAKYDNNYDNNMWWYWPDWWPDDIQKLRWKGGNTSVSAKKGMRERIPLNAAVSPSTEEVQEELVQLFDGTETSTNEELRADGATPLAASIYGNTDLPLSAYKFFINKSGAYDGICQANWLVVMTDGDDSFNESVSGAVQSLYNGTKSLRDKKGNTLQYPVRTMVIGFVTSKDADGKYTSLANKLNDAADIGFDGVDNDKPAHAYYADNFDELFAAFEDILVTIKEMSGRKSPPRLRAGLPGLKGDVYVPEMVFWETKLWEGKLHKFILDNDGSMGDTAEWESSFPAGNSRVVLTANWYGTGGGYGGTNLVSFKDLNWESLAEELGIRYALSGNSMLAADDPNIETQTKCFIRWYRGEDPSCANWEQRKSPMADMDRSGIAIVSIPQGPWGDGKYLKFKRDHEKRPERLYIQSSEGTLHSFNTETGREEWAFIPPQALRWARIAGLKAVQVTEQDSPSFWKWNWYGNDPAKADEALPREILGGPLVAEDVLVNSSAGEKYATVLLGSMGYGGYGLYALDITDVAKPRFLWAIENAAAVEPKVRQVNPFLPADTSPGTEQTYPIQSLLHWEGKASDTIPSATFRTCTTQNGIFRKNNKQYRRSNEVAGRVTLPPAIWMDIKILPLCWETLLLAEPF